ncbi:TPA: hypothetical protein N0F65_012136 [Lagenidium giganteum]|uniref:JmjC domain-containing protein n=1 Tax=Lagenidium giganteum TaxID=4803 RepID=A0AAV2YM34_9STRA|nr:TPA: hypothetical protein N0F65_012136 [Lagenidium giganteum]
MMRVLATSAPLDTKALTQLLLLVAEGLHGSQSLRKKVLELRSKYAEHKLLGSARAVSGMLALLEPAEDALAFFKDQLVGVIIGSKLPQQVPQFQSIEPEPVPERTPAREAAMPKPTESAAPGSKNAPLSLDDDTFESSIRMTTEARKRALEYSSSADEEEEEKKKPKTAPSEDTEDFEMYTSTASTTASNTSTSKSSGKRRMDNTSKVHEEEINPTYSIPTHWEDLYYKDVEAINIHTPGAMERINALRLAGTPFLIEGHKNWMKFTNGWLRPNGTLDTSAFLRGIHDVKVPVIEKNYEEFNPIKTHLPLGYYVKNYWEKGKPDYYMHQWQFPLTPKAAKLLCYKCEELPVLGDNLLLYWLDAVRGDNPLQYFFMGQRSTTSRMHQDPGGLDITIAPILGTKRVTMLHRDAAKLDSVHETVNFHDVDLNKIPLLAFIPAWRVDVKPGQILYMPEGTFHGCENITACLSYHRFHVDHVNLPGFLASFMAQDSPSINHAEILWNSTHDVMAALEENYHANGQEIDNTISTLRKLDSLRALRHATRVLSLESALPTEDSWDWNKLLEDIDHLLVRIDARALHNAKKGATIQNAHAALSATAAHSANSELVAASKSKKASASSHWDNLNLKIGDIIGVQVFEKRNRAQVLKIALNQELVQIHYVDWGSIYDEFLPVSSLFQRTRGNKRIAYKKAPKVHETVLARWGSNGQLYNAIVLKVIRTNACLVHYLKYEKDWDQWILPGHIFKKYETADDQ